MQIVLSLFPGIGLLDRAFEDEGFCVVRGPDRLWGGDIARFSAPPGAFAGIIGGPPCQAFSSMQHIVRSNGYEPSPDLIPEFARVVAGARPDWFLMENVEKAPQAQLAEYAIKRTTIRDVWVGGETSRLRIFDFGVRLDLSWRELLARWHIETLALHRPDPEHSPMASGGNRREMRPASLEDGRQRSKKSALRNYGFKNASQLSDHLRRQGLPSDFLDGSPLTVAGKIEAIGNGVPMAMGRAVARATACALRMGARDAPAEGVADHQPEGDRSRARQAA